MNGLNISVLGINHKSSHVEIRERMSFALKDLVPALSGLTSSSVIKEGVILSTCNRIEIYCVSPEPEDVRKQALIDFLQRQHPHFDITLIADKLYFYSGKEAIGHLFSVAAGLDSMVVGEAQVLGQVKDAYLKAHVNGATGKVLNLVFQRALRAAKKVREETRIGNGSVSVSSAAVDLANKVFPHFSQSRIMIIGAGKMGELTAKSLLSKGAHSVIVANRNYEKAVELALDFGGTAITFDKIKDELINTDIVIVSAAAPHYLIKKDFMKEIMFLRENKSIFFIDISLPRNVDPEVTSLDKVFLYNIDDLEMVVESNLNCRKKELSRCSCLIDSEINKFSAYLRSYFKSHPDKEPVLDSVRCVEK